MLNRTLLLVAFVSLFWVGNVWAEQPTKKKVKPKPKVKSTIPYVAQTTTVSSQVESKFFGTIDLRPSMKISNGTIGSEDLAELGYQFNKNFSLSYQQRFGHALNTQSLAPVLGDGFARVKVKNLLSDTASGFKFHYEGRLYAPTNSETVPLGFLTQIRNYFILEKAFSDSFSLFLMEVPIFYVFSQQQSVGADGTAAANSFFENRIYFGPLFSINKGLVTIFAPIRWSETKYHFAGLDTVNSDAWGDLLQFNPEVLFQVTKGVNIGLEFETDNFFNKNLDLDLGNAFSNGLLKVVFQINF